MGVVGAGNDANARPTGYATEHFGSASKDHSILGLPEHK
jgi:hypothetical protein